MIRIGGKGVPNVQIKLQFNIQNMLIIMFGVVRTVEFNEASNQSLLHFECIHLEPAMRNEVLSFVYDMLPEREKEVYEALQLTDSDEQEEEQAAGEAVPTEDSVEADLAAAQAAQNRQSAQSDTNSSPVDLKMENIENISIPDDDID